MATFVMLRRRALPILVAGALLVGGVAYAAIPDGSGVIHGCYRTSNPAKGALIIIDSATDTCPSGTVALNWNQTGPQGPAGPTGPQGDPVQFYSEYDEKTFAPGNHAFGVSCDSGDVPVGGEFNGINTDQLRIVTSQFGGGTVWAFQVNNLDPSVTLGATMGVRCADYPPYRG